MGEVVQLRIEGQEHQVSVREYQGQRVVTFKDVDELHQRPEGTARRIFSDNRSRFIEGTDYFRLTQDEANRTNFVQLASPNGLTVLTESGYLMLVKSFTDDLAWSVQRELVNGYFRGQKAQQMNPELMSLDQVIALAQGLAVTAMQTKDALQKADRALEYAEHHDAELRIVRAELNEIHERRQEAVQSVLALPEPTTGVPDLSTRARVRRLVDSYCAANDVTQQDVYNILYREVRDRFSKDLKARVRKKKITALEMAEQLGMIEDVYALAYELFGPDRHKAS